MLRERPSSVLLWSKHKGSATSRAPVLSRIQGTITGPINNLLRAKTIITDIISRGLNTPIRSPDPLHDARLEATGVRDDTAPGAGAVVTAVCLQPGDIARSQHGIEVSIAGVGVGLGRVCAFQCRLTDSRE